MRPLPLNDNGFYRTGYHFVGVSQLDPSVLTGVSALVLAVSILAALAAARRATRVDPMLALQSE